MEWSILHACIMIVYSGWTNPKSFERFPDFKFCKLQVSVFNEVTLLERLQGIPGICQLHDYGVCATSAALIMKRYPFSLRTWRERLPADPSSQLRLYLRIFADVLQRIKVQIPDLCASLKSAVTLSSICMCGVIYGVCCTDLYAESAHTIICKFLAQLLFVFLWLPFQATYVNALLFCWLAFRDCCFTLQLTQQ